MDFSFLPEDHAAVKECSSCNRTMSVSNFYKYRRGLNGLRPACIECMQAYSRSYYASRPIETRRAKAIRDGFARLGLTEQRYQELLADQKGGCALCGKTPSGNRLDVDHDHGCCSEAGKSCGRCIRGLLCRSCNALLGWYENHQEQIAAYLGGARV